MREGGREVKVSMSKGGRKKQETGADTIQHVKLHNTHDSLALSSLPPAAVTVASTAPSRVAFLVLACNGLQANKCHI